MGHLLGRPFLGIAISLAAGVAAAMAGYAQADFQLRADSTLVVIPVSVTDASNRFVLNIEKDRFSLFEDGVKQKVTQFAGEDAPLSIGLLVDVSGSMGRKLAISQSAVGEFLKTMNAQDESFLMEFGDRAQVTVPFTRDPKAVVDKMKSIESAGLTALLDAVHLGLAEMKKAKNPRKALLVLSDGGDNNSRYTAGEIRDIVKEADVQIYCMGVFEAMMPGLTPTEVSGPALLAEISEQTGGRVFPARTLSALPSIARRIGVELRNEYILAYAPSNANRDGSYRKVRVEVEAPEGMSNLKARWRSGYYAPSK